MLRYRQEKLDDALEAFSRSAAINPTNGQHENYLGCILPTRNCIPRPKPPCAERWN